MTSTPFEEQDFWKRKLAAFLHDSPSKCLNIPEHHEVAREALKRAGFVDETELATFARGADHTAAAADRLPFPKSSAGGLRCTFDGQNARFRHPFCASKTIAFKPIESSALGAEVEQNQQPGDFDFSVFGTDWEHWRARHFAHWRLWRRNMVSQDFRFDFLPADTRIPDHSIWTHTSTVSALQGCLAGAKKGSVGRPTFLKLQIGGVQEFIRAARNTRDLWSASYLMSWLMAAGLKELTSKVGPDAVIYPNLFGQPLFDLHWRNELWHKLRHPGADSCWDGFQYTADPLCVASLPNVALALVPDLYARQLAEGTVGAIQNTWKIIADAVWEFCDRGGEDSPCADEPGLTREQRKSRYDEQVRRFLSISWSAHVWPADLDEAIRQATCHAHGTMSRLALEEIQRIIRLATHGLPLDDRDERYYTDKKAKDKLDNVGLAYPTILAEANEKLAGVRETRPFAALPAMEGLHEKDALTGRAEAVAGGPVWSQRWQSNHERQHQLLFKHDDWLGAANLIKRTWHVAYIEKEYGDCFGKAAFAAPSVPALASGAPRSEWRDSESDGLHRDDERYFAVLALDGDKMGRWVSGQNLGALREHLADYAENGERRGARCYFEELMCSTEGNVREVVEAFLDGKRSVTPSFHLQFSQALSNFAVHCVRRIVEHHGGYLVLAGGDDVLALLPAYAAIACARDLRSAFRGTTPPPPMLGVNDEGFVVVHEPDEERARAEGLMDQKKRPVPLIVPGPQTDCSVGIAIAHVYSPLQDAVRAAYEAEKRAKKQLGRGALAVTVMKRSGEVVEWGCKWDDPALGFHTSLLRAIEEEFVSARFPHALIGLLSKYVPAEARSDGTTEQCDCSQPASSSEANTSEASKCPREDNRFLSAAARIVHLEFEHVLDRQRGRNADQPEARECREELSKHAQAMLEAIRPPLEGTPCTEEKKDQSKDAKEVKAERKCHEVQKVEWHIQNWIGVLQVTAFASRVAPQSSRNSG